MDWTWLKDYGALVAASVAACVAVLNASLQYRHQRSLSQNEWLRDTRLPLYVELLEAAVVYRSAIHGEHGEWDPDLGPEPQVWPNYHEAGDRFRLALAAVELVGPPGVAASAKEVQFAMWAYEAQLERDPFDFTQTVSARVLAAYTAACREALAIPNEPQEPSDYRSWLRRPDERGLS